MDVILLENIRNLGGLGERVDVRSGYGRNYLFPQGKAVPATEENIKAFKERRVELEAKAHVEEDAAQLRADKLVDLSITITAKAGEEGKLFGSIGTRDIAEAINNAVADAEIEKSEVAMPDGSIRSIGEYAYSISLHSKVSTTVKVVVVAEE